MSFLHFASSLARLFNCTFYPQISRPGKANVRMNRSNSAAQMTTSTCTYSDDSAHDSTKNTQAETETSYRIPVLSLLRAIEAFFTTPNIIQVNIKHNELPEPPQICPKYRRRRKTLKALLN